MAEQPIDYKQIKEIFAARRAKIVQLRQEGKTLTTIAREVGITKQRAWKILKDAGITGRLPKAALSAAPGGEG